MTPTEIYDALVPLLDHSSCIIPQKQAIRDYFPEFLKKSLADYISYFKSHLQPLTDKVPFEPKPAPAETMIAKIEELSTALINTIELYYEGKTFKSAVVFEDALKKVFFSGLHDEFQLKAAKVFYRGRPGKEIPYTKEEMFHIPFQFRHITSTNRYSIPGLPALYMGDSTYICWEELNRQRLRDIYFSKLVNTEDLNVVRIQRFADKISEMQAVNVHRDTALGYLLRHLVLFPLTIACTICVREPKGVFKPEYIIPQFLIQLISDDRNLKIDGIMYTSTKVDYSKLTNIPAYNYILPVKQISPSGFCTTLKNKFELTNPTSLELEEIMENRMHHGMWTGSGPKPYQAIEIYTGVKSHYHNTSFGKLEQYLNTRALTKITS